MIAALYPAGGTGEDDLGHCFDLNGGNGGACVPTDHSDGSPGTLDATGERA
jgi:hypothetical protein